MPLIPAEIYTADQLTGHIAPADIRCVQGWFRGRSLTFRYQTVPPATFATQVEEMLSTYGEYPKDEARTAKIEKMLRDGARPFCVFVEDGDPSHFILEGRHRIVAFHNRGVDPIPTLFVIAK